MKKNSIFILLVLAFSASVSAQETIVYQPDAENGKDAFIYTLEPLLNVPDHHNFMASAWTNGLEFVRVRCLIDVIPPGLPEDAEIIEARLSLYSYNSSSNGPHSTLSGSNASVLRRTIEPWSETEVNWLNQPTTTAENQVLLEASVFDIQDYEDIDITALVQDMVANPEEGHGLMMGLVNEEIYRAMVFGSSDNPNPELRPKVVITYQSSLSADVADAVDFNLYPNPSADFVRLKLPTEENGKINVFDQAGRLVRSEPFAGRTELEMNLNDLTNGIYLLELSTETGRGVKKLVVAK